MARMVTVEEAKKIKQQQSDKLKGVDEQVISVMLSSKGKHGYPETVRLRPLKVKDVKALVEDPINEEIPYVRRLVEVVQGTVLDEGVEVGEMTMPDFRKILLAHRVNSIGKTIELSFRCSCRNDLQVVPFDLMNLDEKMIDDNYEEPVDIGGVQVRFPRVWGYLPDGKKSFDEVNDYDVLASVVIGKDVDDLLLSEARGALDFIKKWEMSYGVQTDIEVPCKYCGKKVKIGIPFFLFLSIW
jgi:hypothetical protein